MDVHNTIGGSLQISTEVIAKIARLAALEGDWRVLPGHDMETTLDFERRNNPYMRQGTAR